MTFATHRRKGGWRRLAKALGERTSSHGDPPKLATPIWTCLQGCVCGYRRGNRLMFVVVDLPSGSIDDDDHTITNNPNG